MVRRKSLRSCETDLLLQEAVLGVRSSKYKTSYEAAKALGLCVSTVRRRISGRHTTRTQARAKQQLLSPAQESVILKWIKELTISGYAPSHRILREVADEIRSNRYRVFNSIEPQSQPQPTQIEHFPDFPLGQDWVPRFIQRHPQLKIQQGRRIEAQRMNGVTEPIVEAWFDAFKDIVGRMNIDVKNIYNMDETGFSIGTMESTRIIVDSTYRTRHQAHPGRQEWISVVECVCADYTTLDPFVIFKGQNVLQSWIPNQVLNQWYFSANTKGWTSNLHGLEWLKRVFEPATRLKANGQQRLLICDGHDSHISGSFISHCIQNRISLLVLPPHTSHLLQPLDVAIFGPLKKKLTTALLYLNEAQLVRIQKAEWMDAYIQARSIAISTRNIESAWRGAGLVPFSPQRIIRSIRSNQPATPPIRPQTPTEYNILNQVFVNSSPPDTTILLKANQVLNTALEARTVLNTPITRYVQKLADETVRLNTCAVIQQRDTDNLRTIVKSRKTRSMGKRAALQGQFHISTAELHAAVEAAEEETKSKGKKGKAVTTKAKGKAKAQEIEEDIKEDNKEYYDSDMDELML